MFWIKINLLIWFFFVVLVSLLDALLAKRLKSYVVINELIFENYSNLFPKVVTIRVLSLKRAMIDWQCEWKLKCFTPLLLSSKFLILLYHLLHGNSFIETYCSTLKLKFINCAVLMHRLYLAKLLFDTITLQRCTQVSCWCMNMSIHYIFNTTLYVICSTKQKFGSASLIQSCI